MRSERTPTGYRHMVDCFLCERPFQFGQHVYAGKPIKAWGIMVCDPCLRVNSDGLVPDQHPRLLKHLEESVVRVKLNASGWLDFPRG